MSTARPQIEHPVSIGIVNKRVLDAVTIAYSVALDLAAQGFTVKGISSSSQAARVWLHPTAACARLASGIKIHGRDEKGPYQIHAASINGCEINWQTRRAA